MGQYADSFFWGAFAQTLSLDELCTGFAEATGTQRFDIEDPRSLPDEQFEHSQALQAVNAFVTSLSPRDQEIVHRIFWQERSQTQVGAHLNISKMAVSKTMARICKRGRASLAAYEHLASLN